jgi:hypothetical protein
VSGTLVVHKRYRLSQVRHQAPFNKTERGAKRRAERRLRLKQREIDWSVVDFSYIPAAPLHSRKDYWRTP